MLSFLRTFLKIFFTTFYILICYFLCVQKVTKDTLGDTPRPRAPYGAKYACGSLAAQAPRVLQGMVTIPFRCSYIKIIFTIRQRNPRRSRAEGVVKEGSFPPPCAANRVPKKSCAKRVTFWEEETQGSGRIFLRSWQKWSLTYFASTRFVSGRTENEHI